MSNNPIPINENDRLKRLRDYQIMDSNPERQFDELTQLASKICNTPVCLVSLIDEKRQWFKSSVGIADVKETPRDISFCQHAIVDTDFLVVSDPLQDERFKNNPLVTGDPNIRFYAGAPIIDDDGYALGTLCVIDDKPNELNQFQLEALKTLANTVMRLIKYRAIISEKNRYVKFFDDSIDLFGIANEKGEFLEVNNAFEQKLEYSKDEIITIPFIEHVYELDINIYKDAFFNTIQKLSFKDNIFRIKSKSDKIYWISWKANYDKITKQFYIIGRDVSSEITNIKKLENELKAINNAVIRVELSPEGKILQVNEGFEKLLGISADKLINKNHTEIIFDEDRESEAYLTFLRGLTTGRSQKGVFRRKGKDDKEIWVKGSYLPVIGDDGEIEKIIKVAYDITEIMSLENSLKQAVKTAEKASKSKDIFLANISHDIRTPLNAISGFSHLLSEQDLKKENNSYVDAIALASKSLLLLINDVLDISKFESDKIELESKPFDLQGLIEDLINVSSSAIKAKSLKFITTIDRDTPNWVIGDPARLIQILSNLIGNATKFTSKGFLKLETYVTNLTNETVNITFAIEDSGIGIEKDKLESIFERFTQENESSTREFSGSGLGLSIVKMLVDLYQGKVEVQSEKGIGSKFTFSCKFKLYKKGINETVQRKRTHKNSLEGLRILIVEDNEHNQIIAKAFISKNKGNATVVENGLEACKILGEEKFDCVLMDLQMPIKNGFEATTFIRKELKLNVPIIACTAHSLVSEKQKAKDAEMNDYLTKPFTESDIVNVILKNCKIDDFVTAPTAKTNEHAGIKEIFNTFKNEEGEDFLIQMLTIFKRRIPQDIIEIKNALVQKDFKTMQYKAHLIAGSLSSFMLQKGTDLAKELEKSALDENSARINPSTKNLVTYLEDVLNYIAENYEIK